MKSVRIFATLLPFLVCLVCAGLTACQHAKTAQAVMGAQTPGNASGAGATFVGPANSAAPSTQHAKRRVAYYAPAVPSPSAVTVADVSAPTRAPLQPEPPQSAAPVESVSAPPPAPMWIEEDVTTTLGQHQDAAGIVKVAAAAGNWSRVRWFGVVLCLIAAGGLLYSHNNERDGYPLVWWKLAGVGVILAVFDPSPWWMLLLVIPAGFYVLQKLNLLRLPGTP